NVLMTYYLNGIQDENELIEFNRNDLPDILLKNRFLNLFSEPMENRDAFIGNKDSSGITLIKDNGEESIIHKTLLDGTMFEWFNLILPKNSVVTRKNKNTISIDMHEFSIEISNCFDRINTFIDGYFYDYYLGIDFMDHSSFKFDIEIKVNFKTKALLMLKKQNYFSWIDEFIETLDEYADCNTFLKNINWKGTKSIITCYKNINKNNND
ncbi:MAG TPA: hypothetical protein DCE48_13760, partial [Lachnospiraceae bacterium]|nr:hypothetical protein [Lachnospiraceae bacterium]